MFLLRKTELPNFVFPFLRDYIYLWRNPDASYYDVCGISFTEFLAGVERPLNLILMQHEFREVSYDWKTGFELVDDEGVLSRLVSRVGEYGNFWWVDFRSREALAGFGEREVLELLYLKQSGRLLGSHRFPTLENRFIYLGHDDGWSLQLYVDEVKSLERILAHALTLKYLAFSGRRSHPIPNEGIAKDLVARASKGTRVLLDFSKVDAVNSSVPIYTGHKGSVVNRGHEPVTGTILEDRPGSPFGDGLLSLTPERLVVDGQQWKHERIA